MGGNFSMIVSKYLSKAVGRCGLRNHKERLLKYFTTDIPTLYRPMQRILVPLPKTIKECYLEPLFLLTSEGISRYTYAHLNRFQPSGLASLFRLALTGITTLNGSRTML